MSPNTIQLAGSGIDLTQRVVTTTTVVASPALAAETIIAQLTLPNQVTPQTGVILSGWAAYTVGTSGTAVQFKVRQTNVSGTTVAATGALTGSQHGAAILSADDIGGFDTAATPGMTYVLTMQVTAGAAASTVSGVLLYAIIV